jgi:hypothetical protein
MPSATITQSRRESGNSLTNAAIVIIVGVLPTTLALPPIDTVPMSAVLLATKAVPAVSDLTREPCEGHP